MGRKKGKQSGAYGSKRLRFATECRRWSEASDDLARNYHRRGGSSDSEKSRAPAPLSKKGDEKSDEWDDWARVRRRPEPEKTFVASERRPRSLTGLCVRAIGANLDRFSARDPGTRHLFELLPEAMLRGIAAYGRVTDLNAELLVRPGLRRVSLRGPTLGDAGLKKALIPTQASHVVPDSWEDADFKVLGCLSLRALRLDADLSLATLSDLASAHPLLSTLTLGSGVLTPPDACLDSLLGDRLFPALVILDLTRANWCTVSRLMDFARRSRTSAPVVGASPLSSDSHPFLSLVPPPATFKALSDLDLLDALRGVLARRARVLLPPPSSSAVASAAAPSSSSADDDDDYGDDWDFSGGSS